MLFVSFVFLFVFLPVTWVGFQVLARQSRRLGFAWLVLASLFFYGWWNPRFVCLLLISVTANYLAGQAIALLRERPYWCRAVLTFAVCGNLAALAWYKYLAAVAGFLIGHGIAVPDPGPIILPVGISFFTFTQIAYLLDVAWGEVERRDPLSYALFVTFFPHLLAGPILHHQEMMPQFARPGRHVFSGRDTAIGASLFVMGMAKKVLIADMVAPGVGWGFAHAHEVQFFLAWKTALSYSIQLYFDFSGYSDMAIGLARMFGIRFPLNFNSPYKAGSVIEYWQRWHMTLTRYLTQYLFNPMALALMHRVAGRRRLQGRRMTRADRFLWMVLVPMMATMAIAGVWHGAGLQFVVFGLLHGVYLSVNHAWRIFWPPGERPNVAGRVGSVLLTYGCVLVGAVFFRADSVTAAVQLLAGMGGLHGAEGPVPLPGAAAGLFGPVGPLLSRHGLVSFGDMSGAAGRYADAAALALIYAVIWGLPNTQQIMARYRPALGWNGAEPRIFPPWRISAGWGLAIGALGMLALTLHQTSEFIYFQF